MRALAYRSRWLGFGLLVALWLLAQALAQRPDHDESQYVAGAILALGGMPYRDFMLLQPPLHAWAFAPLAWTWPTDSFVAMRIATGGLALLTLGAVHRAQRAVGVAARPAATATLLMGCCASFQFCAAIVRNDMLAVLLLSLGIWALLLAERDGPKRTAAAAGLAFGLAVATKLSVAPLAAAAGLHLLLKRRTTPHALPAFAIGAACGVAPALIAFATAPEAFLWGVFTFASTAPFDWYARIGAANELTLGEKLSDIAGYMLIGPALAALLLVTVRAAAARRMPSSPERLLILLILGGLAGAAMPTPTHKQYLLPALPPIFIALGTVLAADGRRIWKPVLILSALVGLVPTFMGFARTGRSGFPALAMDDTGDRVGDRMRALGLSGPIASLSPERAADSGFPLDPRFATGPFVFRSGGLLTLATARRMALPTPASVMTMLRDRPPAAILLGYEHPHRAEGRALDLALAVAARRMGWRAVPVGDGQGTIMLPGEPFPGPPGTGPDAPQG